MRKQRFDIMVYGNQTYESWAAMTTWQRNDLVMRLNKKFQKEKEHWEEEKAKIKGRR